MEAQPNCGRRSTVRRAIIVCGSLSTAALLTGCAQGPSRSLAKVWDDLPKVSWSRSQDTADEAAGADAKIADSSPAGASASDWSANSFANRFKFSGWSNDARKDPAGEEAAAIAKTDTRPHDPFLEDELGQASVRSADSDHETDQLSGEPKIASQRDRLKAALSDDSRRNRQPEVDLAAQERSRVRVEALMIRATQQFEQGELHAAQRDAELARHLAEECSLEFSPDEERPVDLLSRIVARLESLAAAEIEEAGHASASSGDSVVVAPAEFTAEDVDFDPYAAPQATTRPKPKRRTSIFNSSIVVLETPSFEDVADEPAVNPTSYAAGSESQPRSTHDLKPAPPQADAAAAAIDQAVETAMPSSFEPVPTEPADHTSELTPLEGPSFGEVDLPPAETDAATDADPLPRRGTVTLKDIDAEPGDETEEPAEILSAQVVPRWAPLAALSAIVMAISLWLIRRRMTGRV